MSKFLPHYINEDLNLPNKFHYTLHLFFDFLSYRTDWTDIEYQKADFNINDTYFNFTRRNDVPQLKIDFPTLKEWTIKAKQEVSTWIIPLDGDITLELKDFDFNINTDVKLDVKGNFDFLVYDVGVHFGDSFFYFHHDNWFLDFFIHQMVYIILIIIQNSVYFVGDYLFTYMLGPVIDAVSNHYRYDFTMVSPLRGQKTIDKFQFDYRNTYDPYIGKDWINLYFVGELYYKGEGCSDMKPKDMHFFSDPKKRKELS